MKKIFLLFIMLLNYCSFFILKGQNTTLDSLENLLSNHHEADTIRIKLLNKTAYNAYRINIDKVLMYAQEAIDISRNIDYKKGEAESLRLLGLYHDSKSDYSIAKDYFRESLALYNELGDQRKVSFSFGSIGLIYQQQGNYPKALEYSLLSLKILEQIGDKRAISNSWYNIGVLYMKEADYIKALEYFNKSLKIGKEIGHKVGISNCYIGIGLVNTDLGDYSKAFENYQKSLDICLKIDDKNGASYCYNNIGELFKIQENYAEAMEYYEKSLSLNIELGRKSGETYSYKELGSLYLKQKKPKEANYFSKKAFLMAKNIGNAELIMESSEIVAQSSMELGLYKDAYNYHVIFKTINDSLYNAENVKKIIGLEYEYKYEREKQAILLDQKRKEEIHTATLANQKAIRNFSIVIFVIFIFILLLVFNRYKLRQNKAKLLLEKQQAETENRLLRSQMNPHFIFNSLYSIQGFIANNKSEIAENYLVDFASLMRSILTNSSQSFITFDKELESLKLYLKLEQLRFKQKFKFSFEIDEHIESEFTMVPPMLIQPFVENSILHGIFPKTGNGQIILNFAEHNHSLFCIIIDDGIGREESMRRKKGKGNEHSSAAIEITKNRLNLIGQELGVETSLDIIDLKDGNGKAIGTKVEIIIPTRDA